MIRALDRPVHRPAETQIGLNRLNLPDAAERLEMECEIRPAHRHPHAISALGERAHHVAANKTGAAENGDEFSGFGHWRAPEQRKVRVFLEVFLVKAKTEIRYGSSLPP